MKYTNSHEWAVWEEEEVIIGITEFAKKELDEIVYLQLPKIGTWLEQGEEAVIAESTKAASDIYAPVTGRVCAINASLQNNPSLLHQKKDVWLFRMVEVDKKEYETLLNLADYTSLIS